MQMLLLKASINGFRKQTSVEGPGAYEIVFERLSHSNNYFGEHLIEILIKMIIHSKFCYAYIN